MSKELPRDRPPQVYLSTALMWMLGASLLLGVIVISPAKALAMIVSFAFAASFLYTWYKLMKLKIENAIAATVVGIAGLPILIMGLIAMILFIKALLVTVTGESLE
jgi:hypothetical protein